MVSTGWGKRASQLLAQTTQKTIFMGSTLFRGVEGGGSPLFAPPLSVLQAHLGEALPRPLVSARLPTPTCPASQEDLRVWVWGASRTGASV